MNAKPRRNRVIPWSHWSAGDRPQRRALISAHRKKCWWRARSGQTWPWENMTPCAPG